MSVSYKEIATLFACERHIAAVLNDLRLSSGCHWCQFVRYNYPKLAVVFPFSYCIDSPITAPTFTSFMFILVLAIVLSVLLRFTDSHYPFDIFKLFLQTINYIGKQVALIWVYVWELELPELIRI